MRYKIIKSCAPGRHVQQAAFSKNVSFKNQFSNWCGNLPRTADCKSYFVSFRTSPQTGVGISIVIETALLLKKEIATPVCALARNDGEFAGSQ